MANTPITIATISKPFFKLTLPKAKRVATPSIGDKPTVVISTPISIVIVPFSGSPFIRNVARTSAISAVPKYSQGPNPSAIFASVVAKIISIRVLKVPPTKLANTPMLIALAPSPFCAMG